MLSLEELEKVLSMKKALSIPLIDGSCFGVQDPRELRPPFNSDKTRTAVNGEDAKEGDKK